MDKVYSGLHKALQAIGVVTPGNAGVDAVDRVAALAQVKRKTVLNWLRADGTPLGESRPMPDNKMTEAAKMAGGPPALARELGVTPQAVREWIKYGYAPPERAKQIEILYGIPRVDLVSPKVRSAMGIGGEL